MHGASPQVAAEIVPPADSVTLQVTLWLVLLVTSAVKICTAPVDTVGAAGLIATAGPVVHKPCAKSQCCPTGHDSSLVQSASGGPVLQQPSEVISTAHRGR